MGKHYTYNGDNENTAKAWAEHQRVHFKDMFETGRLIKGMNAQKALRLLEQVINHERAVPFRKYAEGIPHHAQGKEWGCPTARWPQKSCKLFIQLIKNAIANATAKSLNAEELVISHVQCNRSAQYRYRRIHQAHGRVKSYASPPTCVQICLSAPQKPVESA